MITIAWYNVVAIIVGIIALGCTSFLSKDTGGMVGGLATLIDWFLWLVCVVIFYAIWGGIYWW